MIILNRSTTERLEPMSFYKQCYYNRCKAEQSRNSKLRLCKLHDENAEKYPPGPLRKCILSPTKKAEHFTHIDTKIRND